MTIVEELDKKSGRPHRSKNIVDAMKYLFSATKTPQNIAEAVKDYNGGGEAGYLGMTAATIALTTKSLPEGSVDPDGVDVTWRLQYYDTDQGTWYTVIENTTSSTFDNYSEFPVEITVPVIDGMRTYFTIYGSNGGIQGLVSDHPEQTDCTGDVFVEDYQTYATGSGTYDIAWAYLD